MEQKDFKGLTLHQKSVLEALLDSPKQIVRLEGPAGVGKSFLLSRFVRSEYIRKKDYKVMLCGTTHRAVANLAEIGTGILDATTIHSFLGMKPVFENGEESKLEKSQDHIIKPCDFLIVDESSMLNTDLVEEIIKLTENQTVRKKVIIVGDPIQLIIDKTLNLTQFTVFSLTEQMRQSDCPHLSSTLSKIRTQIDSCGEVFKIEGDGKDIIRTEDHAEFLKLYAESVKSKIILAFRNEDVKLYNSNIIKYLLKKDDEYSVGDVVFPTSSILDSKGYAIIKNRERCVIENVIDFGEYYSIYVNHSSSSQDKNEARTIKVSKNPKGIKSELKKLADSKSWLQYYAMKNEYATVHHAYASTIHSAQGMSVDQVFVDMSSFLSLKKSESQELLRMIYVAMSRARVSAVIYVGRNHNFGSLSNQN